jgi:hypothetical protein
LRGEVRQLRLELCKGGSEERELRKVCTGVCDKRTWAREAEEFPLLYYVAKERLGKTQQAGKGLAGAVVSCEVWRSAVAL